MNAKWFEIPLDVRSECADEAVALLAAEGFAGCEVREGPQVTRLVVFAQADDIGEADVRARAARAAVERFSKAEETERAGGDSGGVVELDPAVWTDNWRRHFSRRTFAGRIEVLPPWEKPSAAEAGLLSIVINPGMAFGTGLHETTASCLELLVELIRPGDRIADVGCGSGILALAALRLGASSAHATDIDPLATDAARENAELNDLQAGITIAPAEDCAGSAGGNDALAAGSDAGAGQRSEGASFDLVVANILAETLVELRQSLISKVRDGGVLVLSGIETTRLPMVLDAFVQPPWTLLRRVEKGEWATVAIQRTTGGDEMEPATKRTLSPDLKNGDAPAAQTDRS